jgi:hypothetical protein
MFDPKRIRCYRDRLKFIDLLNAAENQSFWLSGAGRLQNADGC